MTCPLRPCRRDALNYAGVRMDSDEKKAARARVLMRFRELGPFPPPGGWTLADAARLAETLKPCPSCGSYSPRDAETCDETVRTPWGLVVCGYSFGGRQG